MGAATSFLNTVANAAVAAGNSISLHTADPGTTGANEISGGSPAYARQTTAWGSAVAGVCTGSLCQFNVAGSIAVAYFGVWNGSTFLWGQALSPGATLNAQGVLDVTPIYTYSQT